MELNNPFYRLPTPENVVHWRDDTPEDFSFAVKVSRYISHVRRLQDAGEALGQFLERAVLLGSKLGPLLVQLPPQFQLDLPRLDRFLGTLAAGHRWTLEVRHPSWQVPEVYEMLGRRGVALCVPVGGRVQPDLVTTAPFTYLRMHAGTVGGAFSDEALGRWARRIRALVGRERTSTPTSTTTGRHTPCGTRSACGSCCGWCGEDAPAGARGYFRLRP